MKPMNGTISVMADRIIERAKSTLTNANHVVVLIVPTPHIKIYVRVPVVIVAHNPLVSKSLNIFFAAPKLPMSDVASKGINTNLSFLPLASSGKLFM